MYFCYYSKLGEKSKMIYVLRKSINNFIKIKRGIPTDVGSLKKQTNEQNPPADAREDRPNALL